MILLFERLYVFILPFHLPLISSAELLPPTISLYGPVIVSLPLRNPSRRVHCLEFLEFEPASYPTPIFRLIASLETRRLAPSLLHALHNERRPRPDVAPAGQPQPAADHGPRRRLLRRQCHAALGHLHGPVPDARQRHPALQPTTMGALAGPRAAPLSRSTT